MSSPSSSSTPASSKANPKSRALTKQPLLTPRMQDLQARNKDVKEPDPYDSDSSDSPFEGAESRFDAYGNDTFEQVERRREAAVVLDSPELLMMHAQARNDSIPGTRYYFTKMLCGYLRPEDRYDGVIVPPAESATSAGAAPSRDSERGKDERRGKKKGKGKSSS